MLVALAVFLRTWQVTCLAGDGRLVASYPKAWWNGIGMPFWTGKRVCTPRVLEIPLFRSVLTEREHALISVTTRRQRCAGLILLRSGLGGLPFGGGVIVVLPVFRGARRAPCLARDHRLEASTAYAKLFSLLAPSFLTVAGGL